jgi:hypothetical protein
MGVRAFFLSMRAVRLDDETAERMLAGIVDPADAPPGYAAVAELLETARSGAGVPVPAPAAARPLGDFALLERASLESAVRRPRAGRRRVPVLAAVAFCAMTGGAYAAGATGAGSSTVSAVLDRIGVGSLVGAPSGDHASSHAVAALKGEASAQTTTGAAAAAPVGAGHRADARRHARDGKGHGKGKGAEISTLARTTDATGVDKGAEISTAASEGQSQAGQHSGGAGASHPDHPSHPGHPSHPDHPAGGAGAGSNTPAS